MLGQQVVKGFFNQNLPPTAPLIPTRQVLATKRNLQPAKINGTDYAKPSQNGWANG